MVVESFIRSHFHKHIKHVSHEKIGTVPKLMFISEIHGNEGGVIEPLKKGLNHLWKDFPDNFPSNIRIFKANPDALEKQKRSVGVRDMNREFKEDGKNYWAVKEIKRILSSYPEIEYIFSFHEEADKYGYKENDRGKIKKFPRPADAFYMYDAYDTNEDNSKVMTIFDSLKRSLLDNNFSLYTGYDDYKKGKKETVQRNWVEEGYCLQDPNKQGFIDGTFENWVVNEGLNGRNKVKRSFVFEIPHDLSEERKQHMVKIILEKFIVPFLNQTYNLNFPELSGNPRL